MKGAVEAAHMGHPDFRVNGRIFATLRSDNRHGMVALTPDQQQTFMKDYPAAFSPEAGAWGRQGCTAVRLEVVDDDALGEALTLAWQNGAAKAAPARRTVKRARPAAKAARRRKTVRRDR
jgi:hypothetical protein